MNPDIPFARRIRVDEGCAPSRLAPWQWLFLIYMTTIVLYWLLHSLVEWITHDIPTWPSLISMLRGSCAPHWTWNGLTVTTVVADVALRGLCLAIIVLAAIRPACCAILMRYYCLAVAVDILLWYACWASTASAAVRVDSPWLIILTALTMLALPGFGIWFTIHVNTLQWPLRVLTCGYLACGGLVRVAWSAANLVTTLGLLPSGWITISNIAGGFAGLGLWMVALWVFKRPKSFSKWMGVLVVIEGLLFTAVVARACTVGAAGSILYHVESLRLFAQAFALTLATFVLARRERIMADSTAVCRVCGYNLTGNLSGVCPECGTLIALQDVVRARATRP